MNCKECEATFSDLYDGDTRSREAARARAHLAVCSRCGESYRAFEEAMGALRREPLEAVPEGFAAGVHAAAAERAVVGASVTSVRPWRLLGRVPAAAALLLAAGLAAGFATGRSVGRQDSSQALAELEAEVRGEREGSAAARGRLDVEMAGLRRSVATLQEDLRRANGILASLRQERDFVASLLEGARREAEENTRDLRRRLDEALKASALTRVDREMAPRMAAAGQPPRARENPREDSAQPQAPAPSVVALDRRDRRGGTLSIDMRGPDEQVIPELLALSENLEPEVARLARRLLRERSPGLQAEEPPVAAPSGDSSGSGMLLGSFGGLVERAAERLGVREPRPEATPPLGSPEEQEVERLKRYWTSRGVLDSAVGPTMKL